MINFCATETVLAGYYICACNWHCGLIHGVVVTMLVVGTIWWFLAGIVSSCDRSVDIVSVIIIYSCLVSSV